jgi:hypothetical protein
MALSTQALEAASLRADPVADAAISAMFAQGARGGDLLAAAKERKATPAIAALLAEGDALPADPEAMERTRRLVLRYAPPIGLALGLKALPTLYALPEIAEALVATGRLIQHGERRMRVAAREQCPGQQGDERAGRSHPEHALRPVADEACAQQHHGQHVAAEQQHRPGDDPAR